MNSGTQFGFEEWLPRRAALLTALGIWVAGFALAGATAWRMQHPTAGTDEMNKTRTSAVAMPNETPVDVAESEKAVFVPEDVVTMPQGMVVGRSRPRTHVTLAGRTQRPAAGTDETHGTFTSAAATPAESEEDAGAPRDAVVGRGTPRTGVTLMQRP